MSGKKKVILGIIGLFLLLAAAGFGYNYLRGTIKPQNGLVAAEKETEKENKEPGADGETKAQQKEAEPVKALDFTATDADGNEIKLSDFIGKPIVLNFWASWCPPCKEEMPVFNSLHAEVGQDVVFIMMNATDGERETVEKGKAYIAEQGFTFPVYYDTKGEVSQVYGISSLPTTLFIDKDGNIAVGAQGAIDEETLRKGLGYITEMEEEQ